MDRQSKIAANEIQMQDLGKVFSQGLRGGDTVHLHGDLGAGKTTFVRGVLAGLGYFDEVLSPTFSLVETYRLAQFELVHFDLYRLTDPYELELMGYREYFNQNNVIFIEWPCRALEMLPEPNYDIEILAKANAREIIIK